MKKALVLAAMFALVATASADIRIFLSDTATGDGLVDGAPFDHGEYMFDVGTFAAWGADAEVDPATDFHYLWLQFNGEAENRKIQGINISVVVTVPGGDPTNPADVLDVITDSVGYRYKDTVFNFYKRWDGANPIYLNPSGVMAAVTANGIQNAADPFGVRKSWDYATRTALVGAVAYAPGRTVGDVHIGIYDLKYEGITERPMVTIGDTTFQPNNAFFQYAQAGSLIPEPASLLLLGLAGLLIRRR